MMASRPKLIVHIGPHKTGTTFLQNAVFPNVGESEYWGRFGRPPALGSNGYYDFMRWVCGGDLEAKSNLIDVLSSSASRIILISEEWLSSEFSGRYFPSDSWQNKIARVSELQLFACIKLVYCRREPAEAVPSLYREFLQEGLLASNTDLSEFITSNDSSFYCYRQSHKELVTYFGNEGVCWFPYQADGFKQSDLERCFSKIDNFDSNFRLNAKKRTERGVVVVRKKAWLGALSRFVVKLAPFLSQSSIAHSFYSTLNRITSVEDEVIDPSEKTKKAINEYFRWDG